MAASVPVVDAVDAPAHPATGQAWRIALLGNPNTGKTTLFNLLSGLRHKTSNFPGTTQEARLGRVRLARHGAAEVIDLPGVYSLELGQAESVICRAVLAGVTAPVGDRAEAPNAAVIVVDATNLARNLTLAGEALRRRLPTVVALNMIDLARKRGMAIDIAALSAAVGCEVVPICARTGEGAAALLGAIDRARPAKGEVPEQEDALASWAQRAAGMALAEGGGGSAAAGRVTDRVDRVLTHGVLGPVCFALVMTGLFWVIFSLAATPMEWIGAGVSWAQRAVGGAMPAGLVRDMLADGVMAGVGTAVTFVPQVALLFGLISLLEDSGYLARAAFVMDRVLGPFGLSGHSFVPLLSSHACALPGIIACRGVPDRRDRLATILVAPFMSCTARIPVYVLLCTLLFRERPALQALAFAGCYLLGILAGLLSALAARRTILRGAARPMAMELPTYKWPSVRTAALTAVDRSLVFLRKAGTVILVISMGLWWLGAFPRSEPPAAAVALRARADAEPERAEGLRAEADHLEAKHRARMSFIGRAGAALEPVFAPLGWDRQLITGVVASFAAREVFVSTMAVVTAGEADKDAASVVGKVGGATRDDGVTPVFTAAASWSLLVYYVLSMQCLPTLAVTARETGSVRWALLQLGWMSGLAFAAAALVYQGLRAAGVA